jgi:transposase, IS30 family
MNGRKRRSDRSGRAPLPSPGRPPVASRDQQGQFWAAIAMGLSSEDAGAAASVPQAVGARWFRKAGGMPPAMFRPSSRPLSGRYLSFAEREEIALLRAQGCSMQDVARRIGRAASTVSRELRRNAATRGGGLEYRATTAQWHAERSARRPKPAKLAVNTPLRDYVEERLAGQVIAPSGTLVPGPAVAWKGLAAPWFPGRPWHGRGVGTDGGRTGGGPAPGAQSRSHGACRSTSRMTAPCGSATKPSTKRCSSKAGVRCAAS